MKRSSIELENPEITKLGVSAIIDFYQTISSHQLNLPGLHAFSTGIDSASLNVVLDVAQNHELGSEKISQEVSAISNFFQKQQVPWGWFVTAIAADRKIENFGFNLTYESAGMYLDLSNLLPEIESNEEKNIIIKEEFGNLQNWIKPIAEAFPSTDGGESYRKLNADLLDNSLSGGETKLRHFTAYHQNKPAASATLFLSNKGVMLHNIATKHNFRKLGLASSLTRHLLSTAKKSGHQHCFLDSSNAAVNLYRRLGFKIYCVTREYEKS